MKIKTVIEMNERDVFELVKEKYVELTNIQFEDVELIINKELVAVEEEIKEESEITEATETTEEMNPNIYGGIY